MRRAKRSQTRQRAGQKAQNKVAFRLDTFASADHHLGMANDDNQRITQQIPSYEHHRPDPSNSIVDVTTGRALGRPAILLVLAKELAPDEEFRVRAKIPGIEGDVLVYIRPSGTSGVVVDSGYSEAVITRDLLIGIPVTDK